MKIIKESYNEYGVPALTDSTRKLLQEEIEAYLKTKGIHFKKWEYDGKGGL